MNIELKRVRASAKGSARKRRGTKAHFRTKASPPLSSTKKNRALRAISAYAVRIVGPGGEGQGRAFERGQLGRIAEQLRVAQALHDIPALFTPMNPFHEGGELNPRHRLEHERLPGAKEDQPHVTVWGMCRQLDRLALGRPGSLKHDVALLDRDRRRRTARPAAQNHGYGENPHTCFEHQNLSQRWEGARVVLLENGHATTAVPVASARPPDDLRICPPGTALRDDKACPTSPGALDLQSCHQTVEAGRACHAAHGVRLRQLLSSQDRAIGGGLGRWAIPHSAMDA